MIRFLTDLLIGGLALTVACLIVYFVIPVFFAPAERDPDFEDVDRLARESRRL